MAYLSKSPMYSCWLKDTLGLVALRAGHKGERDVRGGHMSGARGAAGRAPAGGHEPSASSRCARTRVLRHEWNTTPPLAAHGGLSAVDAWMKARGPSWPLTLREWCRTHRGTQGSMPPMAVTTATAERIPSSWKP